MNAFLLYIIQSALCLSLFYGLYLLLLRREVFFRFNRNVLLTVMLSSLVIPLIRVPVAAPALVQLPMMHLEEAVERVSSLKFKVSGWKNSDMIFTKLDEEKPETSNFEPVTSNFKPETSNFKPETSNFKPETLNLIPLAYLAGLLVSLALALISFVSVARIIVTARPVVYRQQRILVSPLRISSFTFAGWIVISEMDFERFAAEIITHETIHRRRGHFWDLCLVNAIAVVHWFNPLVWLLRREVKTLHEYEADRCTLTQGIDATRYQLLLIEKAAGASRYSVASGFAQSKIKKRIVMMNKQNPNPWARWKVLLFIPLAALLVQAFARPEIKREFEQFSTFKGTEILQENTRWTEEKFLEELRKCLPEGVSRELSYDDTWKEIEKTYQFELILPPKTWKEVEEYLHPQTGILIIMDRRGEMSVNNASANMEDISSLVAKNLANKGKPASPIIINGKEVEKIIRFTLIQREITTPADDYQKLYQNVGEAYMQKRDEIARQYYQTGYNALDAEKKTVIDDVVPMLVMIRNTPQRTIAAIAQPEVVRQPTEEEWKKAATKSEKIEIINNQNSEDIILPDVFKPLSTSEPSDVISESANKDYLFFPSKLGKTEKYTFSIFNRTGQAMFKTTDPNKGWNGYFKGRLCNEGVYVYMIEGVFETGQAFSKIGNVTLQKITPSKGSTLVINSDSPDFSDKMNEEKMPSEAKAEFEKINNRQIPYNGRSVAVKDLYELLNKDTNGKVKMFYNYRYDKNTGEWNGKVGIAAPAIDPKDPAYFYVNNGKWVYGIGMIIQFVYSIDTYTPADAVKKYGSKAKNGAISITSTSPVIVKDIPPPPPPIVKDIPDKQK